MNPERLFTQAFIFCAAAGARLVNMPKIAKQRMPVKSLLIPSPFWKPAPFQSIVNDFFKRNIFIYMSAYMQEPLCGFGEYFVSFRAKHSATLCGFIREW
jgi:hypothetical protein